MGKPLIEEIDGDAETASGAPHDEIHPGKSRLIVLLMAVLVLVVLLGAIIKIQSPQLELDALSTLEITARLKAQLVESWLAERRDDSKMLADDAELIERSADLQHKADARVKEVLRQRIVHLVQSHPVYHAAFLLDAQGEVLLTVNGLQTISPQTKSLVERVLASGESVQSNFYIDMYDGFPSINFVVPFRRSIDGKPQGVAALVLHTEPNDTIFPLLLSWPTNSLSGETLLVRGDGDSVVFLSQVRHLEDTALKLRRSLADPSLPAALAIRKGVAGTVRGRDYRGVEVLAAFRPVTGTDWHVVVKMDYDEVMAPLWKLVAWVALVVLVAILGMAVQLRRYWSQREHLNRLAARARQAQGLRESEARFRAVAETARDAIVTAGADGSIIGWNPAATRMFGYTADEIIGQPLTLIIPQRFQQRAMDGFHRMLNGDPDHLDGSVAELIGRRKDDSEILIDRAVALWETAAGRFYTCTMRDISEQRVIEEKLNLRSTALEASANAIIITDATGKIEWANPAFCALSGYSLEETLEHNPRELIKSGMQTIDVYQELWCTILAGKVWRGEMTNRRKDGTQYLEGQTITPVRDEDGTIRHFISIKQDITERRQLEEQTHLLLAQNETILSNALVGIVYLRQRLIVSCNRRVEELFQYEPGELIGASSLVLYDSIETYEHIGEVAYKAVAAGGNYSTEVMLRHKDGSLFWGALSGRAIDPSHPHDGSIWVYADITERRSAELETNKLLQAVEQSPVSIVITDKVGTIEYVNPSFTRITGYTRHEAVGQNPRILQTEATTIETYQELWGTILAGKIWKGVLRNRCKNGDLIWEDTSISPILNEAGEITHFVAVKEDVTERKRIEQQLEEHQGHLEDLVVQRTEELSAALEVAKLADKSKDEFLANITHELRTPLSAVIGFSSLARPLATDTRQREYLDKVNSAGKTLAGIIDDLLDLSKIVAGRLTFECGPFSLRHTVGRSRLVVSYKAQEKGLQLIERIAEDVPDVLIGDSLRLEQILLNLLSNAVKFTAVGRVELRVGLLAREEARVCLNIEVEDTGIGLTEDGIAQLFKPFSQADASMTRKFGGTGLGLAICKRLAEMMGGEISVTSREGSGTTFCAKLWFGLGEAKDLPVVEEIGPEATQMCYQDVRVLVVDDQPFNRDVVDGLLAAVGITPHLAENGQQAVGLLTTGMDSFDLILMDVQMPVMDGLTATRAIRQMDGYAKLPIIAMTAHTMTHEKERCIEAGMNDHIGKPFDETDFYRVLAKWIPRSKQHQQTVAAVPAAAAHGLPSLPGIDVRAGLALLQGNEARYRQWLSVFITEMPATMAQLRQVLTAGQSEPASMVAHTLKGRTGLLGMNGLHTIAAALEAAIDAAQPTRDLLLDLEHEVAAMCEEIRLGLGLEIDAGPAVAALPDALPPGPPPASVMRLIERLQAGDSESDVLVTDCLAELKDTPWVPHLRQVLIHVQNFDFAAAGSLLGKGGQQ